MLLQLSFFFFDVIVLILFRFPNLGIQCAKKKEVTKALNDRKEIRVDPFNSAYTLYMLVLMFENS